MREISRDKKLGSLFLAILISSGIALGTYILGAKYDLSFTISFVGIPESLAIYGGYFLACAFFNLFFAGLYGSNSIKEKWPIACQRTGLTMWQNNGRSSSKTEIPEILKVCGDYFRVRMKGLKLTDFEERKINLGNSLEIFIWSIEETKSQRGERIPGQVDIYYSRGDLPKMIPLTKAAPPKENQLNLGLSSSGWQMVSFRDFMHGAIAGTSGGGKSVLLRSLFTQIMTCSPKSTTVIFDFKGGAEFFTFSDIVNVAICDTYLRALRALDVLFEEYERRAAIIKTNDVDGVYDLPAELRDRQDMHPVWLIIDECAEIFTKLPKETPKDVLDLQGKVMYRIDQVSRLTRFVGIHLLPASQVMSTESITSSTRANLQTRISFRQFQKELSTMVLFGRPDAVDLTRQEGRFLMIGKDGIMREIQGIYVEKKEAKGYMQAVGRQPSRVYRELMAAMQGNNNKKTARTAKKSGDGYNSSFQFAGGNGQKAAGKIIRSQ